MTPTTTPSGQRSSCWRPSSLWPGSPSVSARWTSWTAALWPSLKFWRRPGPLRTAHWWIWKYAAQCCPLLVKLESCCWQLTLAAASWFLSFACRLSLASMWRLRRSSWLTWSTMTRGGCGQLEIEASRKISRSALLLLHLILMLLGIKVKAEINGLFFCLHRCTATLRKSLLRRCRWWRGTLSGSLRGSRYAAPVWTLYSLLSGQASGLSLHLINM